MFAMRQRSERRRDALPKLRRGASGCLGPVAALPIWLGLTLVGEGLLGNVGMPGRRTPEFYVSWGATGYFVFLTLLAFAGLIVAARARLSLPLRVFIITLLCVMLGLFSICDLFALSSQSHG